MNGRKPLPVRFYTPESALASPRRMVREMFSDLRESRELAWRLAVRDINAQYRQTLLGFFWVLLLPLAHAAVWIFLAASEVLRFGATEIPYPAHVLAGTMLWAIFSDAVHAPLNGVAASRDMLVKLNFPREAIVISGIYQVAFNGAIKLAIVLTAMLLLGIRPDGQLLLVPLGLIVLLLTGTAIGLLFVPVGLLYTDVAKGLPIFMQFLMYLTPVVYPLPDSGITRDLLTANPITAPIEVTRQWLSGGAPELIPTMAFTTLGALVLGFFLWLVYRLAMPIVIERMSS